MLVSVTIQCAPQSHTVPYSAIKPMVETLEMGFPILGLGGRSADSGFTAQYQLVRYISDER